MSLRRRMLGGNMGNAIQIGSNEYPMSLEAMFYALENGTGATGTFMLESALPNTETLIAETGLEEIHGLMFLAEGFPEVRNENTSLQTTGVGLAGYENGEQKSLILIHRTDETARVLSNSSTIDPPVTQGTLRIDGGDVYCTAKYSKNESYTPFESGIKYRWIAW